MKLFIDTANIEEIKEINDLGVLSGVTTNPSLIAKEGRNIKEIIGEISKIVDGPISAELISTEYEDMLKEGRELAKIDKNIVVKVPMTQDGLKAIKTFSKEGIKTNTTLIFSLEQALLAARAGTNYVSPFLGRLDDIGASGISLVEDIAEVFEIHNIETEIIAASIRSSKAVADAALVGSDIATIPYKIFKDMMSHPLTDRGIKQFIKDWENSQS